MKGCKKYLYSLLTGAAALTLAFGLVACDTQNSGGVQTPNCEVLGHDFVVDEENSIPASCETDGLRVEKCQRENCGATQETTVLALGHIYKDGECACGSREYPDLAEYLKYILNEDGESYSVSFWESAEEAEQAGQLDLLEFGSRYPQAEIQGVFKLPAERDGIPVTGIAAFGFAHFSFESIKLPETLTTVGAGSFSHCELKSIELPDSVTEIGESAFSDCGFLESVRLSDSLACIEEKTFQNCTNLTEIVFSQTLTTIEGYAFFGCEKLGNVTLPDGITDIGTYVFSCSGVESATLGTGITVISEGAFEHCLALTDVEMLGAVTSIGAQAFRYCERLSKITIPETVYKIETEAFRFCHGLTEITIPAAVNTIENLAFETCSNLTKLTCENNVRTLGDFSFSSCPIKEARVAMKLLSYIDTRNLERVTITSGTNLLANTFENCTKLTSVVFESDVTKIGESAFEYCTSLTSIQFPDSLTTIESRAFIASGLTEVTLSGSITKIGEQAFADCANLTRIVIGENVEYIGREAFHKAANNVNIVFEKDEGWVVSQNDSTIGSTAIDSADLQSLATAGEYLTVTYTEYYWLRVKESV